MRDAGDPTPIEYAQSRWEKLVERFDSMLPSGYEMAFFGGVMTALNAMGLAETEEEFAELITWATEAFQELERTAEQIIDEGGSS